MLIGHRLRELREAKRLTQRDIEKSTGLICAYISRVENGHTVPSVPTLEKLVRALQVPIYLLFYDGKEPLSDIKPIKTPRLWGSSGKDALLLAQFSRRLSRMQEADRQLLVSVARKLSKKKTTKGRRQFNAKRKQSVST